jgi:hypothetical protein
MSTDYPETPEGWQPFRRRSIGPFTTHVTFRLPGGELVEWSSRRHRKHASLLSRERHHAEVWWAPRSASWWIGVLFAVGSSCFLVGPFPGFVELVGSTVDGIVFFVGSISGSALDLARANSFTTFGALCFLIGAVLLLPESAE